MRKVLEVSIVFWLTTLLCSCASVSVVDTWRNPELRPERLHKILVVSIDNKESARRVYEDMLASELSRKGVEAVPGYSVIPGAAFADWGVLDRAVRRAQAQAILTVQTIKVEKQTTVQSDNLYPGYWYPQGFPGWDFPGYYRSMALYGPTHIITYDVATMQVNLFDAGSDKLIWAATMESTDPSRVTTVGQDLARKVVKKLAKEGLI
uniref:DUF4136 domain-containing protein n=1 Tax=Geobacter sp. (strain M21) TaxID=443144 RepID=C6E962_GEOSM